MVPVAPDYALISKLDVMFLNGKRGRKMLYYTVTEREPDNSYQKSQEQILMSLIGQVGAGYTAARLQIMLRHAQASMPTSAVVKRPVAVFWKSGNKSEGNYEYCIPFK